MVANVWVESSQAKRMLASAQAGQIPGITLSLKSKTRSVHNTYFIFQFFFYHDFNHYPLIYNHSKNWCYLLFWVYRCSPQHSIINGKINFCLFSQLLVCCSLIYLISPNPQLQDAIKFQRFLRKYTTHCSNSMPPLS